MTRRTIAIVVLVALALGVVVLAQGATLRLTGNDRGYEPSQPIAYSHRLHAGELEIACQYCHYGAERSRHAGIPPTSVCMNCHRYVTATRDQVAAGVTSSEIQKLYDALGLDANGQRDPNKPQRAIRWRQIHHLPDFVYFDHRRHVAAGVTCQSCHGEVQAMERVAQFADLSMGWCLSCHRERNAAASRDSAHRASTDCAACHY
jgi:hypothetical protein